MVAWLKYVDSLYPNKLRYLGMGNEPWGGCYAGISVQEYLSKWYEPFNNAIPQSFKGKLVRVASYYTTMAETDTVLRRELGNMEGLSYHYYTTMGWAEGQKTNSFNFSETDYYNVLQKAYDIEGGINDVISRMGKYDPNFTYGLQPDEWGAWYNEIAGMGKSYQQSSIRDALIAGQHLNLFNNNCRRIWMAQVAQPCNAIQSMFLTNQTTGAMIKTPTFYTYKLYKPHHNATMIPRTLNCGTVSSKNLKTLTASASIDSTKTIHISITNIHATQAQSLAVTLNGYTFSKVSGEVISGQSFNSINDYGVAENVNIKELPQSAIQTTGSSALTVSIPEHSVVMLTLTPPGTGVTVQAATMENMTVGVSAASGNRILIHHGFTEPTPVVISLFSVDGKLMAPVCKTIARPEVKSLVWVPSMRKNSMRTAVVSITAGGKRGWTEQVIVGR
jgi:alpha-N-arabinofuranosidase